VTFSLPALDVTITLIDGSILKVDLSEECMRELRKVIHEVQLSFAPEASSPRSSVSSHRSSTSSVSSSSSSCSHAPTPRRRSPSALLMSILSPLLPIGQGTQTSFPQQPPQPPARIHRRQARSLLVDTYRRHVLPFIRDTLPAAYLPWAIASETSRHMSDFERTRQDINDLLATAGVDMTMSTPMKRTRSASTSSSATDSDSDSDLRSPVTPATSVFSPSMCSSPMRSRSPASPANFLHSVPPAQAVPISHRNAYASQLARVSAIAARLSSIKKLQSRYEREEGKRRWLESLERGRQGDKGLRRAFSNGLIQPRVGVDAKPIKRSSLWRSWTAADQARVEKEEVALMHPAMAMDLDDDESFTHHLEEVDMDSIASDENAPSSIASHSPPIPPRRRSFSTANLPNLPDLTLEDGDDSVDTKMIVVHHSTLDNASNTRPPLTHRDANDEIPNLVSSTSDESLAESEEWDVEAVTPLSTPSRTRSSTTTSVSTATVGLGHFTRAQWDANVVKMTASSPAKAAKALPSMQWENGYEDRPELQDPNVRIEVYGGVEVIYA